VTGSQFLLPTKRPKILVDCGMFQGNPNETEHNRAPLAYDATSIDALLLTHAHLDHCGLIPYVVKQGMRAPIFATAGTVELATVVLLDSGKLQEEFAKRGERRRVPPPASGDEEEQAAETRPQRREARDVERRDERDVERAIREQQPSATTFIDEPLYTAADAQSTIRFFHGVGYGTEIEVAPGVKATFLDAGHILGSAIIRVVANEGDGDRIIVFSGDLGRPRTPIIRDPTVVTDADYVLMEATYGGREHEPSEEAVRMLSEVVRAVADAKGVLVVPSYAIGRTQEVVYALDRLLSEKKIPRLPLFLDSPMASKATDIYKRHREYFDAETRALLARKDDPLDYPGARVTNDASESKKIRSSPRPYMVVASNGMLTGGRVLHHLKDIVDDPAGTLLFVGYQGQGTLGAHLQAGAREITLDGQVRQVRCRVVSISGFSAHADESELLDWLGNFKRGTRRPKRVFIVHGDPPAEAALEPKVRALGFDVQIPTWRETVQLT
jgi:metallo-beta-lactamase family protein